MAAKMSLDKLSICASDDSGKHFPAINKHWVEDTTFVPYPQPPVCSLRREGVLWEEWLDVAALVERDLQWALSLSHHCFWSQLIYDESFRECVNSFLKHSPRLERLFFLVILRASTHKESENCFITPQVFANIIYDHDLFNVPKIIDVCAIFSKSNFAIVGKLVKNIFTQQPRYMDDLRALVPNFLHIFHTIQDRCNPAEGPVSSKNVLSAMGPMDLEDIVLYACDSAFSLFTFLECYRPAYEALADTNFCVELCSFYEYAILEMEEALKSYKESEFESCTFSQLHLSVRVYLCKEHLTKTFRSVLYASTLQILMDSSGSSDPQPALTFLDTLTMALSQPQFLLNYNQLFPVRDDLEIVTQMGMHLDTSRQKFLLDGLSDLTQAHSQPAPPTSDLGDNGTAVPVLAKPNLSPVKPGVSVQADQAPPVEPDMDLLISQVKDLFPDLGDGFVEECLRSMTFSAERVVNAVLEGALPVHLQSLDRTMARKQKSPTLLSQRRNVFDNDQFDVFNRTDVDLSMVHRKKTVKPIAPGDPDLPDSVKAVIHAAAAEAEAEENEPLYDDDYDDTYDDHKVGADDADSAEEFLLGRKVVTPIALRRLKEAESEEYDSSDGSPARDNQLRNDPPKVWDSSFANGQPGPAAGAQPQGGQRKSKHHDVKGGAKGQGQTKDVLHNRQFKDKHKSSMANHNRKKGADRKLAQGMFR